MSTNCKQQSVKDLKKRISGIEKSNHVQKAKYKVAMQEILSSKII